MDTETYRWMKLPVTTLWLAIVWIALGASPARAALFHDPALKWRTIRTEHFAIHFPEEAEGVARETAAIAEAAHARLAGVLGWTPRRPTDIVLTDRTDVPNGFAEFFPTNRITIYLAPPDRGDLIDTAGWLETVIVHEYAHILHLDQARGLPRTLRRVFGRHPFLFPAAYQPAWLLEGLATHYESDAERGTGRGQSTIFDMYMRVELADGLLPLERIGQPIVSWPGGLVPYLYGVELYDFVAQRHGEERVAALVEEYSDNLIPYLFDRNSRKVLGTGLRPLWRDFEQHLRDRYAPQIAGIEERGAVEGERLTGSGYVTGPARVLPDGTVFYLVYAGRREPELFRLDTAGAGAGEPRRVGRARIGARFDVHPTAGVLLAQPEPFRNVNYYQDLYRLDPATGRTVRLTRGGRYRSACWSPDGASIAAVRSERGRSELHLLDAGGRRREVLWAGEGGELVGPPDWSPDGRSIAAAVWRPEKGWDLELFSLADRSWRRLTGDRTLEADPQFTADGSALLFASDHGGVWNVRRLDLASGEVATLTNVRGGAFQPSQASAGGPVYYTGYGPQGFDVHRLAEARGLGAPEPEPGPSAMPLAVPSTSGDLEGERYAPGSELLPHWWFPFFTVGEHQTELGFTTSGRDALQRHGYFAALGYDLDNDEPSGGLVYVYDRWFPVLRLQAARANDVFEDTRGRAALLRRSDDLLAEVVLPLFSYERRWTFHLGAIQERDSFRQLLPLRQVPPDRQDDRVGVALTWDSARRYPFSISRSRGHSALLAFESSELLGGDFSGELYKLDWRSYVPVGGEQVLALRLAGGYGTEGARRFHLGGEDGAFDLGGRSPSSPSIPPTPFDDRDDPLRGYPDNAFSGRRMLLASLEWRFPIRRVERGLGLLPLGLENVSGRLFGEAGSAWDEGSRPDDIFPSAGLELLLEPYIGYVPGLELRLGFAHGFEDPGEDRVYAVLGTSF